MKKYLAIVCLLALILGLIACQQTPPPKQKPLVLCSMDPYQYLIRRIAGDTVNIQTIVPPSADIHTYEPTIRQMQEIQAAELWFYVGEPLETHLIPLLKENSPLLSTVDLKADLPMIGHSSCCSGQDLHIWLSPKLLKIQTQTIEKALENQFPEHRDLYLKNLSTLTQEINQLDQELTELFQKHAPTGFMISHPALAYFCRDYNLTQLSIEHEGKNPTPQHIISLIQDSKSNKVKSVFVIPQMDRKKAQMLAENLGLKIYDFNPYSADCLSNLKEFAYHLTEAQEQTND